MNVKIEKCLDEINKLKLHFKLFNNKNDVIINYLHEINNSIKNLSNKLIVEKYSESFEDILLNCSDTDVSNTLIKSNVAFDWKLFISSYSKLLSHIKYYDANTLSYIKDNKWMKDINGVYIIETICHTLQKIYLKYNLSISTSDNMIFLTNQKYIYNMGKEIYKKKMLKEVKKYLKLNRQDYLFKINKNYILIKCVQFQE